MKPLLEESSQGEEEAKWQPSQADALASAMPDTHTRLEENQQKILDLCSTILEKVEGEDCSSLFEEEDEIVRSLLDRIRDYTYILPIALSLVVLWVQKKSAASTIADTDSDTDSAPESKLKPSKIGKASSTSPMD